MRKSNLKNKYRLVSLIMAASVSVGLFGITAYADGPGVQPKTEQTDKLEDNTLEWGEIDQLINRYNPTVLKNRNDLSKDERRTYDAQQVSSFLLDAADDAENLADQMADVSAMAAANYQTTANSLRMQAESNVSDFEVIKMEYQVIEKQTAENARTAFLNYHTALLDREFASENIAYLEKVLNSTNNRKNLGMATEIEALTAKENLDNARAAVLTTESSIGNNRTGLLVMCGWKYDADAVIAGLPEVTAAQIADINFDSDKQTAMDNNLTLKMDARKLENAKSGNYTPLVVEQNQNQLNNDTSSFNINFKSAYDGLVNASSAYTNAVNEKNVGAQNLAAAEKQLGLGMISSMEYEGSVNKQKSLELAEKKAYISLAAAKAKYDAAVGGLL